MTEGGDDGFPVNYSLTQVLDHVIQVLVQYNGFDPDRLQNAQRKDHLEL